MFPHSFKEPLKILVMAVINTHSMFSFIIVLHKEMMKTQNINCEEKGEEHSIGTSTNVSVFNRVFSSSCETCDC